MRLKDVLRAAKSDVTVGEWRNGHVTYAAFPQSKVPSRAYKLGPTYEWTVIRFSALGARFRVLVIVNTGRAIFRACLGMEDGKDMRILCHHEYHASEPGWHCHVKLAEVAEIEPGCARSGARRWPQSPVGIGEPVPMISKAAAYTKAMKVYRIESGAGPLL